MRVHSVVSLAFVALLLTSSPLALGEDEEPPEPLASVLHCCFAMGKTYGNDILEPTTLVCNETEDDEITSVPFAVLSERLLPPWRDKPRNHLDRPNRPFCGVDAVKGAHTDVTKLLWTFCVGKQRCELDYRPFLKATERNGNTARLEMLVRWTCLSDVQNISADAEMRHERSNDGADMEFASEAAVGNGSTALPALPLKTKGSIIVDAAGDRFRMVGVNWAGTHIIGVPPGLDRTPLPYLTRMIRTLGFNMVRLPLSVEVILGNKVVDDVRVAANPWLKGRSVLDVVDHVVQELGRAGVLVWLDIHMLDANWCCSRADCNGLWYNPRWSQENWTSALRELARRSVSAPAVIGIGLLNEPRGPCHNKEYGGEKCDIQFFNPGFWKPMITGCTELRWADGPEHLQWKKAAEAGGRAVLAENPRLLVSVSGISFSTDLRDFGAHPVDLPEGHVVYEFHHYPWSHGPLVRTAWQFRRRMSNDFDYLLEQDIAPVWVSETGFGRNVYKGSDSMPAKTRRWLEWWSEYTRHGNPLTARGRGGLDMAWWQLSGEQVGGTGRSAGESEWFGVLNHCYTDVADEVLFESIKHVMRFDTTVGTSAASALHFCFSVALLSVGTSLCSSEII